MDIFWTVFGTIISGLIVYIFSQIITEFVIKPHIAYKKLKRNILYSLTYYSNMLTNPFVIHGETVPKDFSAYYESEYPKMSEELRKLGSEMSTYKKRNSTKIYHELIGLSNSTWEYSKQSFNTIQENRNAIQTIRRLLNAKEI